MSARSDYAKARRKGGRCDAVIHHGPGHQSSTFCEQSIDKHEMFKRRKLHSATFGRYDQYAEWFGASICTDYFDDAPTSPRERP